MRIASHTNPDPLPAWATLDEKNNIWYYFQLDFNHPDWLDFYSKQLTDNLKLALEAAGFSCIYKMPW